MDDLIIKRRGSKGWGYFAAAFCIIILGMNAYLCIDNYLKTGADASFYSYLIISILAIIFFLKNICATRDKTYLIIDNYRIKISIPLEEYEEVEWVQVSRISIGASYLILHTKGGQKQEKINLSLFSYNDVLLAKAKTIELCDFKNIPYNND